MHALAFSYVLTDLHDSAHRPGQDATGADSAALGADGRARADRRERDRFGDEMLRQEQSGRDPFKVPARRAVPSGEVRIAKAIRPQSGPGFAEVRRDVALGPAMRTSTIAATKHTLRDRHAGREQQAPAIRRGELFHLPLGLIIRSQAPPNIEAKDASGECRSLSQMPHISTSIDNAICCWNRKETHVSKTIRRAGASSRCRHILAHSNHSHLRLLGTSDTERPRG